MNETVYLQIKQNIQVDKRDVRIGDVADVFSNNSAVTAKVKTLPLVHIPEKQQAEKICVSVMKVIAIINKEYPGMTVNSMGENDFVVDYIQQKKRSQVLQGLLIGVVCLITFLGSAYGIMAYNNDVNTQEIFERAYGIFQVSAGQEYHVMEIAYAVGLSAGIIIFYNHFGKKRFTKEPTPLEVEMDKYDKDSDTALIDRRDAVGKERK